MSRGIAYRMFPQQSKVVLDIALHCRACVSQRIEALSDVFEGDTDLTIITINPTLYVVDWQSVSAIVLLLTFLF